MCLIWHRSSSKYIGITRFTRVVRQYRSLGDDRGLLGGHSLLPIQTVLETQDDVPRSSGDLQNHQYKNEYGRIPTILVRQAPSIPTPLQFADLFGHRDGVETRGNFAARGRSRGNENRRWHGTRRNCNIGDRGFTKFCTDPACSLCCILQSSFDLKYFKGATGWGRFGSGIYLSSTSSKFASLPSDRRYRAFV